MFDSKRLKYLTSLYINSQDRQTGTNLNNALFHLNKRLVGIDYLAVNSISLLNNSYDITGSFKYNYNATDYVITFNSTLWGEYTATALATLLQAQIRTQTTSAVFTVVFNTVSNQFVFNSNNASTLFVYNFTNLPRQMGMVIDSLDSATQYPLIASTTFTFPYPVNLTATQYFDFSSSALVKYQEPSRSTGNSAGISINGGSLATVNTNQILYRLRNNLGFGNILFEKDINLRYIKTDRNQELDIIDISVYDHNGQLVNLNNSCYNLEIALFSEY